MARYRGGHCRRYRRRHSTWRLTALNGGDCLSEVDAAVVQRPADDCTTRANGRHRGDVFQRCDAPRGDDIRVDLLDEFAESLQVGASERAVTSNVGVDEMAYAAPSQSLCHLDGASVGLSEPAIGRQPAISGIERNRDAVTPARDGADDQLRIPEGDGAKYRAVDTSAERIFEI